MRTVIYLLGNMSDWYISRIPAGWYSQTQEGSHENQHIVLRLESTDPNAENLPPFTYWSEERNLEYCETIMD